MGALFGPAGNSDSFTAMGYKKTEQIPQYIKAMGLTAYEYQCGRGVKISTPSAQKFGELAAAEGIALSVHAPYYISLSSTEEEKRIGSIGYILQTARAAKDMGATRIVIHSGSCGKMSREAALELAMDTMKKAVAAMDEAGYGDLHICPETMGKINQLGDLNEVLTLCTIDERLIPCIDFGHLNARTQGGLASYDDFAAVLDATENKLGKERAKVFHSHFSKIEYSAGGEKRHLTFSDRVYGPSFEHLARLIAERDMHPTFICESAGTQAEDAIFMMEQYSSAVKAERKRR